MGAPLRTCHARARPWRWQRCHERAAHRHDPVSPTTGNNHLELAYTFNNHQFHRNQSCWVEQLDPSERTRFVDRFNNEFRTSAQFISSWQTIREEGFFPFKELLNGNKYSDGARLCYPQGTDERVPQ